MKRGSAAGPSGGSGDGFLPKNREKGRPAGRPFSIGRRRTFAVWQWRGGGCWLVAARHLDRPQYSAHSCQRQKKTNFPPLSRPLGARKGSLTIVIGPWFSFGPPAGIAVNSPSLEITARRPPVAGRPPGPCFTRSGTRLGESAPRHKPSAAQVEAAHREPRRQHQAPPRLGGTAVQHCRLAAARRRLLARRCSSPRPTAPWFSFGPPAGIAVRFTPR